MLKSFRLQGDILSYSPVPSKTLILPHLLKNLRKKYYLCEQSIGSNDDAALLFFFFFTPVVHLFIFFTLKLLQKNLRYTVPETRKLKHSDQSTHWAPGCHKDLFLYFIKLPLIATFKRSEICSR